MADHDQRAGPAVEVVLDDGQGVDVEVVGGLVEEQDVGFGEQQPQQLQPAALPAGQVVEPGRQLGAREAEALQQGARGDLGAGGDADLPADALDGVEHALAAAELGEGLAEVGDAQRASRAYRARGRLDLAVEQAQQRRLARAVDADQPDPVAGADRPGEVVEQHPGRSPRPVHHVVDVAAGRRRPCPAGVVAKRCSSKRSRGGGSSAIRALAASIRNCGFEVRAGGPRRSQASSLRSRLRRRASARAGLPGTLGAGEHVRRIAAVVRVDARVVDLPDPGADRVEEPAVVADHEHRDRAGLERVQVLGEPGDGLDVEVVGRLVEHQQVVVAEQQRDQGDPAAFAAAERVVSSVSRSTSARRCSTTARVPASAAQTWSGCPSTMTRGPWSPAREVVGLRCR